MAPPALGVISFSIAWILVIGNKQMIKRNINSFFINLIASLINMSKFDKNTYIIEDINIFSVVNILVLSKAFIRDFKSCMITLRRWENGK